MTVMRLTQAGVASYAKSSRRLTAPKALLSTAPMVEFDRMLLIAVMLLARAMRSPTEYWRKNEVGSDSRRSQTAPWSVISAMPLSFTVTRDRA